MSRTFPEITDNSMAFYQQKHFSGVRGRCQGNRLTPAKPMGMSMAGTCGVIMIAVVFVIVSPAVVSADSGDASAREAFSKGTDAYQNVEFSKALAYFEEAYRLRPTYKIQYNIAQTYLELNRPHLAMGAFEKYLSDGRTEVDRDRREEVVREIRKLRKMVGEIVIIGKTGAECRIDDKHMGFLPLDRAIRLDSGIHDVTIHLHGEIICQKTVNIVAEKKRIEQCRAHYETQAGPEPESAWDVMSDTTLREYEIAADITVPVVPGQSSFFKVAPWVAMSLSGVAATTGTVLALKTNSLNSELSGACENGVCGSERKDDVARLPKLAAGADIMFVATAVFMAAAITLFAIKKKKSRTESAVPQRAPRALEADMSFNRQWLNRGEL